MLIELMLGCCGCWCAVDGDRNAPPPSLPSFPVAVDVLFASSTGSAYSSSSSSGGGGGGGLSRITNDIVLDEATGIGDAAGEVEEDANDDFDESSRNDIERRA